MNLRLTRVSKRFGSHIALEEVSLELENIHSLVLIGPSGGGKSTLLRVIGGLESPDSGEVEVDGRLVRFEHHSLLQHRRSIGTVFQLFNLFPHLTALRNITLPLEKVHGRPAAEAEEVAYALLSRFQLESHAHKRPAQLSGGQRQRVAIARALSIKPRLLLFDEPTSALDPEMSHEVLEMIQQLRQEGISFVLVTHEMAFASRVADQVVVIAAGKVVEHGATERVFQDPQSEVARRYLTLVRW